MEKIIITIYQNEIKVISHNNKNNSMKIKDLRKKSNQSWGMHLNIYDLRVEIKLINTKQKSDTSNCVRIKMILMQ